MIVLREHYKILIDWKGKRYLGLDLDWDYENCEVHLSMLGYVAEDLTIFRHKHLRKTQDQTYPHTKQNYCAKAQYAKATDESPPLSKEHNVFVQEVTVTLLYYAREVDPTMLTSLGSTAEQKSNPIEQTMQKLKQLLDYTASHTDAILTYQATEMVLAGHSDTSYLSEKKARSRAGGNFFISNNNAFPPNNDAVFKISKIIKAIMS